VLAAIVVIIVAILYHYAPNVKRPRFRWMSAGALLAIAIWFVASIGFAFYVVNFSHYNATYGALGGVIIFLLWLWITNNALLLGAEFDAEVERGRELRAGIHAERDIQLPPRDTRQSDKRAAKREKDIEEAIRVREAGDAERRRAREREEARPKNPVDDPADFV
ncbi:MAG: ribonuclease, partial [Frondihabitans sp.]|nr:ribonuclease [Frondihabitans sp.]